MGVDASIYAKNAKKYFYFDRLYNINPNYWDNGDNFNYEMEDLFCKIKVYSDNDLESSGLDKEGAIKLIQYVKNELIRTGNEDRGGWCDCIIKFINLIGEDTYFVVPDNSSLWPYIIDQYEEVDIHL